MADKILSFKAQDIPQISTFTIGGTWANGETVTVTCNQKAVTVTVVTGALAPADVAASLAWAINSSDATDVRTDPPNDNTKNIGGQRYGEFRDMVAKSSGADLILTSAVDGVPFTVTGSTNSAAGTIPTNPTATQTATGKNWVTEPTNYVGGVAPVANDVIVAQNSSVDLKYGLGDLVADVGGFRKEDSYKGNVGLKENNTTHSGFPYPEYRDEALEFKFSAAGSPEVNLGSMVNQERTTEGWVYLLFSTSHNPTVNVFDAPPRETDGKGMVQIRGGGDMTITCRRGSVDIGDRPGDPTSTVASLSVSYKTDLVNDADVRVGEQTQWKADSTGAIVQTGGWVRNFAQNTIAALGSWFISGGVGIYDSQENATAVTVKGGGTLLPVVMSVATLTVEPGGTVNTRLWDGSSPLTVTNCTIHQRCHFIDPVGKIKPTNGFSAVGTWPGDPNTQFISDVGLTWTAT